MFLTYFRDIDSLPLKGQVSERRAKYYGVFVVIFGIAFFVTSFVLYLEIDALKTPITFISTTDVGECKQLVAYSGTWRESVSVLDFL